MTTISTWLPAVVGLASAIIVASANFIVQRWRYLTDRLSAAVDHLCNEINIASDLATKYWLFDTNRDGDSLDASSTEPLLIGRQLRLQELLIALAEQDLRLQLGSVNGLLLDFYEAMTGGQFGVRDRDTDPAKARQVQAIAAQLNGELRQTLRRRNRHWF